MEMDLVETPFRVRLFGRRGPFDITCVGASGMKLVDAMWAEIKTAGVKTKGVNHWVYLANGQMFVGVELAESGDNVRNLERIDVFLPRQSDMSTSGRTRNFRPFGRLCSHKSNNLDTNAQAPTWKSTDTGIATPAFSKRRS